MGLDIYGSAWCINHCLPLASFNLLHEKGMQKCFNWNNLRPMYIKDDNSKRAKVAHWLYLIREIKNYQFLNLNEEG